MTGSRRLRHLRAAEKALARLDDQLRAAAEACVGLDRDNEPQHPADADGWKEIQAIREVVAGTMDFDPRSELTALINRVERAGG